MSRIRSLGIFVFLLVVLTAFTLFPAETRSQSHSVSPRLDSWSPPMVLHQSSLDPHHRVASPVIIGDSGGELHVFWALRDLPGEDGIFYIHGDGRHWSEPVNAVVGPNTTGHNHNPAPVIDSQGYVHLFWDNDQIYYSSVHLSRAGDPHAWSQPVLVSSNCPSAVSPDVYLDDQQTLHLVYACFGSTADLFYVRSEVDQEAWSLPVRVSRVAPSENAGDGRIIVDDQGTIHVVWTQYALPDGWPPMGLYYAQSMDGGRTWSDPVRLGGEKQGNGRAIVADDGTVHVVWFATGPGRYYRWSRDGGQTWSESIELTRDYGMLIVGSPQLTKDSDGQLHWCMAAENAATVLTQIVCTTWDKEMNAWPLPVSVHDSSLAEDSPSMTLTGGNRLHLVWMQIDENASRASVLYASRQTEALPQDLMPVPNLTPEAVDDDTMVTEVETLPILSSTRSFSDAHMPLQPSRAPVTSILAGVAPVTVLVGVVYVAFYLRRTRRE